MNTTFSDPTPIDKDYWFTLKHKKNEDLNISSGKIRVDWRTAKKYANGEVSDPALLGGKGGMMYTEKFIGCKNIYYLRENKVGTTK
jgi:hypothetical protein